MYTVHTIMRSFYKVAIRVNSDQPHLYCPLVPPDFVVNCVNCEYTDMRFIPR